MALNIKSAEAHRLARQLAELRESSLTEAVTAALAASLASATEASDPDLLLAEVAEIQRFVAGLPDRDDVRAPDEILGYDPATGLPG